jgi:hypothetical protein
MLASLCFPPASTHSLSAASASADVQQRLCLLTAQAQPRHSTSSCQPPRAHCPCLSIVVYVSAMVVWGKFTTWIKGETKYEHAYNKSKMLMHCQRCDRGNQIKWTIYYFALISSWPCHVLRELKNDTSNQSRLKCMCVLLYLVNTYVSPLITPWPFWEDRPRELNKMMQARPKYTYTLTTTPCYRKCACCCYILIQILQSKGQLLMSGARPVAGCLGRVERAYIYSL